MDVTTGAVILTVTTIMACSLMALALEAAGQEASRYLCCIALLITAAFGLMKLGAWIL